MQRHHTNHREQVQEVAEQFKRLLKRPTRRHRGTFAEPRLTQLEKAISQDQVRVAQHLAELFCGWVREGVSMDDVEFFRQGEAVMRAFASQRPTPPDEAAMAARVARESSDVFAKIPRYFENPTDGDRRDLAREAVEASDAFADFAEVLTKQTIEAAA